MQELKIDRTIRELIPPLTENEYSDLEANIVKDGKCRDSLIIWSGTDIILDGHNRYEICKKHGIDFNIELKEFATKKDAMLWMISNQLGRRNISDAQKIELALKREKIIGTNIGTESPLTRELQANIADETNTSKGNVTKVKAVLEKAPKKVKDQMRKGDISINKAYEKTTGKLANDPKPKPKPELAPTPDPTPAPVSEPEDSEAFTDDEEECPKCHGTGKIKKVLTVIESDCITCGECGRKHYTNLDTITSCKSCGHKWKF